LEQLSIALPVLPGKTPVLKEFVKSITDSKWEEYSAFQQRYAVHKVTWTLQSTPKGDFFIIYNEAEKGLSELFRQLFTSTHPFDVWARQKLLEITGIDPKALKGPLPEQLLKYGY